MNICEIVDAVSKGGGGALAGPDQDGRFTGRSFKAIVYDWEKDENDDTLAYLVSTEKEVTVWNNFPDDMTADQHIVIGRENDGRWVLLAWWCD